MVALSIAAAITSTNLFKKKEKMSSNKMEDVGKEKHMRLEKLVIK